MKRKVDPSSPPSPPFDLYRDPTQANFSEGFASVIQMLKSAKRIVVLTGAGISVSCGIPDFRTEGSGLYSTLDAEGLGLSCPEELFDFEFFQENPTPFFLFARNLYFPSGKNERTKPSDSHRLLALLEQNQKLLRVYSQNIDGLEQEAGVSSKKIVYAHGSLQWATCCKCRRKVSADVILDDIKKGSVARCQAPSRTSAASTTRGRVNDSLASTPSTNSNGSWYSPRKRGRSESAPGQTSSLSYPVCGGVMKPDVVFFGEHLNDHVHRCLEADYDKVDALIVIGTSLSVAPISKIVNFLPTHVPRILINRTVVHPSLCSVDDQQQRRHDGKDGRNSDVSIDFRRGYVFDAYLLGFCDDITRIIVKHLFENERNCSDQENSTGGREISISSSPYVFSPKEVSERGELLACVNDFDDHFKKEDFQKSKVASNIPFHRLFLFPGAESLRDDDENRVYDGGNESDSTATGWREIVHCNGCNSQIDEVIYKCTMCFDYDLCPSCYLTQSKRHYGGVHHFVRELSCSRVLSGTSG